MRKNAWSLITLVAIIVLVVVLKAVFRFKPDNWKIEFADLGTSSSPQAVDLNGDGVMDFVIGAGAEEFFKTDRAVMAIDGTNGAIIWKVGGRNQVVGSPLLLDVTKDDVPDVFIGGRSALLFCIDGKLGKVHWELLPDHDILDILNNPAILNFCNPQLIPDINNDGVSELLVAYDGFIKAKANDPNRPVGYLMILDPVTGKILRKASMPDNNETYMSPVVYDFNGDGDLDIIFGSGRETLNGHLFKTSVKNLLENDISNAIVLDSGQGKGFVAPPILADVNHDAIPDIIVNAVNGRTLCFNGLTNAKLWEVSLGKGFEIYTTPAPGRFTNDQTPDFFCSFGKGAWPDIESSINVTIDGKNGEIIFQDTLGTFQYASPVVVDITQDGMDDILLALNIPAKQEVLVGSFSYLETRVAVFDIKNRVTFTFDKPKLGKNQGSTPLLTDLDGDEKLDVIYCYSNDATNSHSFKGMTIERIEIDINPNLVKWRSYMNGNNFQSLYTDQPKLDNK